MYPNPLIQAQALCKLGFTPAVLKPQGLQSLQCGPVSGTPSPSAAVDALNQLKGRMSNFCPLLLKAALILVPMEEDASETG